MSVQLNKQLEHEGFQANSYEEVSSYVFLDGRGEQSTNRIFIPIDYQYDGSLWREVELLPCFERYFCLMRQPEMNFSQLWELYITTSNDNDEIGSLSVILNKYSKELLFELEEFLQRIQNIDKFTRKKLQKINKQLVLTDKSIYTEKLQDVLAKTR